MLPELDYIKVLRRTQFPFYEISTDEVRYEDGLVFINEKVLDDRNQKGDTLGQRRLLSPHKLWPIRKRIANFVELIDCKHRHFIDNRGFYFTYNKTKLVNVVSHRILKIISRGNYSQLFCKDINFFFAVPSVSRAAEWAQVIHIDNLPWKLYSTSENRIKEHRRKI